MGSQFDKEQALKSGNWKRQIFDGFCQRDIKYLYTNSLERIEGRITRDSVNVLFSDSVVGDVLSSKLSRNGSVFADGNNVLMPTPWHKEGSAVIYTAGGGTFEYDLAAILDCSCDSVKLCDFDENGVGDSSLIALDNGILRLTLEPGQAKVIYTK